MIAWQAADARSTDMLDRDDWQHSLFGGVSGGVYWTPHLKSELDFGVSTTDESYLGRQLIVGRSVTFQTSRLEFSRRTLGISQHYQFFENAWFHPHAGAGLHLTWERRTEHILPAHAFDPATGRSTIVDPGRIDGPETTLTLRPFVAGGFKAYMTPRWFFRADSRFAFRRGFEEAHVRVGFGRDW